MATWAAFESAAPELAAAAAKRWPGMTQLDRDREPPADSDVFSVAFLATTRADGSPRLHPFCPVLADGRLFAAIPRPSPKGNDLRRDPRCVIHALPGPDDDELCIRAEATEVLDDETRRAVAEVVGRSGVGGMIESTAHDPLFEFDLVRVDVGHWVDIGQPGIHSVRDRWPPPAG